MKSMRNSPALFPGMIRRLAAMWAKHATGTALAVVAAGLFAVSTAHAAPASTLYLTDSTNATSILWTVQGGTGVITSTPMTPNASDSPIAVTNTINTLGFSLNQYSVPLATNIP